MFRQLKPYQLVVDLIIAGLFGLISLALLGNDGVAGVIVILGMTTALALRRLSPGLALAIAWVTVAIQLGNGMPAVVSNAAILAVLYATGSYGDRWVKWLGLASALGGGILAAVYTTVKIYGDVATRGAYGFAEMPQLVFTSVLGSIAAIFVLGLSWTVGLLIRTSRQARMVAEQRLRAEREQRAAEEAVVVEQERNRIARDMHDVVAHSLAVVIAQADGARYAHRGDPEATDKTLATISETARGALGEVRLLLTELRHRQGEGPQPMLADLGTLLEQMRHAGVDLQFREQGEPQNLPTGHQIAVYRIVQEALTNALRHGSAEGQVFVDLAWRKQVVTVRIDNPLSQPPTAPVPRSLGHGLPGMRERAALVGGAVTVERLATSRFVVTADIPVPIATAVGAR